MKCKGREMTSNTARGIEIHFGPLSLLAGDRDRSENARNFSKREIFKLKI